MGGQLIKTYEKTALKFGGTNDDVAVKRPSMPTFPADNQFKFAAFTDTRTIERGLCQANSVAASNSDDVVLTTDGLWIKLDSALKQLQHVHLGSSSTYDWFTCYVASTSGGAVDKAMIVDTNGHIRSYNGGTPTQTYKYKCEKCSDPATVIYRTADPGAFFSIAGVCYQRIGQVITAAAVNSDSITATYASCSECAAATINHYWKKCSDNSLFKVFDDAHNPATDYAWVWSGSAYEKAYDAGMMTDVAATNPCAVEDPAGTPTACGDIDIDYWGQSDLGGSTMDSCRWTQTNVLNTPTFSMTGSGLRIACNNAGGWAVSRFPATDTDFNIEVTITIVSGTANDEELTVGVGGVYFTVRFKDSGGIKKEVYSGSSRWSAATSDTTLVARIARTGSTVKCYVDGTERYSTTQAGTLSGIYLYNTTGGACTCDFTAFAFTT